MLNSIVPEIICAFVTKKIEIGPLIQKNKNNLTPEELDRLALTSHVIFKVMKSGKICKLFDTLEFKKSELQKLVNNKLNESIEKVISLEDELATTIEEDISTNQSSLSDYIQPQNETYNSFNRTYKIYSIQNINLTSLETMDKHFLCVTDETKKLYYDKRYETTKIKCGFLHDFFTVFEKLIPAYNESIATIKETINLFKELDELTKEFNKERSDTQEEVITELFKHIQHIKPGLYDPLTSGDNHDKIINEGLNLTWESVK